MEALATQAAITIWSPKKSNQTYGRVKLLNQTKTDWPTLKDNTLHEISTTEVCDRYNELQNV